MIPVHLDVLAAAVRDWEHAGMIRAGDAIVVGHHEPPALPGALRVGADDEEGRWPVERLGEGDGWVVLRRPERLQGAAGYVFGELAEIVAARHWGHDERRRQLGDVRAGALLRTAVLLLEPRWELGGDRWALVEELRRLGLHPEGRYWVEGVDGLAPPDEEVLQLRRDGEAWVLGIVERGAFRTWGRFSEETDACRRCFREVVTHAAVSMGVGDERPHLVAEWHGPVRRRLQEVLALLEADQA